MLKCNVGTEKCNPTVEVHGNVMDIAVDIMNIIQMIYGVISRDNPMQADMFKYYMKRSTDDDSPVWDLDGTDSKQEDGIQSIHIQLPKGFTGGLMGDEHGE